MSISKSIFAVFGALLLGLATLFASAFKPVLKSKTVQQTKRQNQENDSENLFV